MLLHPPIHLVLCPFNPHTHTPHTHECTSKYTSLYKIMYAHTCVHISHTNTSIYIYMQMCAWMYTCMYMHTHIHTHTHTHTHTHAHRERERDRDWRRDLTILTIICDGVIWLVSWFKQWLIWLVVWHSEQWLVAMPQNSGTSRPQGSAVCRHHLWRFSLKSHKVWI